jgi:triacylglycerol esterase/lipase EstA (alpha/beta hydrolase family)
LISFNSTSLFLDLFVYLVHGLEAPLLGVFVIILMYYTSLIDSRWTRLRVGLARGLRGSIQIV